MFYHFQTVGERLHEVTQLFNPVCTVHTWLLQEHLKLPNELGFAPLDRATGNEALEGYEK